MINITHIIEPILKLIFSVISIYCSIVILPKFAEWLKAKTTKEQREHICKIVVGLVEAAQQMYENNDDKFEYVVNEMKKKGLELDRSVIEAAVYEMKNCTIDALESAILNGDEQDEDELEYKDEDYIEVEE